MTVPKISANVIKESGMKCPNCKLDLVMTERQNIEIDYCPECRGVWLDRGELDKIIERSLQPPTPQSQEPQEPQEPQEDARDTRNDGGHGRSRHGNRGHGGGHGRRGHGGRRGSWLQDIFH